MKIKFFSIGHLLNFKNGTYPEKCQTHIGIVIFRSLIPRYLGGKSSLTMSGALSSYSMSGALSSDQLGRLAGAFSEESLDELDQGPNGQRDVLRDSELVSEAAASDGSPSVTEAGSEDPSLVQSLGATDAVVSEGPSSLMGSLEAPCEAALEALDATGPLTAAPCTSLPSSD